MTKVLTNFGSWAYRRSMSRQVNLYEAKTQLSRLVDEVANGDTIIIAKAGKPMAKLAPIGSTSRKRPRKLGQLAEHAEGTDWIRWWRAWRAADEDIAAEFEAAAARPFPAPRSRRRAR